MVLSDDQRRAIIREDSGKKNLRTTKKKGLKNKGYGSNSHGSAFKNTGSVSRNGRESRREAIITAIRLTAVSLDQQTLFGHVEFVAQSKKQLSPYPSSLRPRSKGQLIVSDKSAHRPKTQAYGDSLRPVGFVNQQNLYLNSSYSIVALGSNTGMGFRLTNDFLMSQNGEAFVWILDLYKNSGCCHYAN